MAILQLRNHIPISAPARREPIDGNESTMRVSLGFEPAWFHRRCGIDFSEHWHHDPYYRYKSLRIMKKELVKAFPSVSYWDTTYTDDLATISGIYGAYVVPQVFGVTLRYAPDRWPDIMPGAKLTIGEIERLEVKKLFEGQFIGKLFQQMDMIESEWGKIQGYLNWQGILNNAFHVRGQEIFIDMYDKPDFVHHFFSIICDVMIQLARRVQERQRCSGFYIDQLSVSNCMVNLLSPDMYYEFVFPYDRRIALSFKRFGVHTCNWDVTPYIGILQKLPKMGYLDMGIMSDMALVKRRFAETRRAVIYSPTTLHDARIEKIREDMEKVRDELAPCDVVMADIQADTPDERVNDLLKICRDIEQRGEDPCIKKRNER